MTIVSRIFRNVCTKIARYEMKTNSGKLLIRKVVFIKLILRSWTNLFRVFSAMKRKPKDSQKPQTI